jgi:hypothetical protein
MYSQGQSLLFQQLLLFHLASENRPELLNRFQLRGIKKKIYATISMCIDLFFNITILKDRGIIDLQSNAR